MKKILYLNNGNPIYRKDFFEELSNVSQVDYFYEVKPIGIFPYIPSFFLFKRMMKADIVISNDYHVFLILNFILCFFKKRTIVISAGSFTYFGGLNKFILKLNYFLLKKNTVRYLAYSNHVREELILKLKIDEKLVSTGIQSANYYKNFKKIFWKNKSNFVIIGNFRKEHDKGLDQFLNLALKFPQANFGIIGKFDVFSSTFLKDLPRNVIYHGEGDLKFIYEIVRNFNYRFCIVPSKRYEPWAWVVPEAISRGQSVIISHFVQSQDIINFDFDFIYNSYNELESIISYIIFYWSDINSAINRQDNVPNYLSDIVKLIREE